MESNLRPIEVNIKKFDDTISFMTKELGDVMRNEEQSLEESNSLSGKIATFSMIILIAMITLGVIETVFIQKYLHSRKVI